MRGSRIGIGIGVACFVVGLSIGLWGLKVAIQGFSPLGLISPPAPEVVRTPVDRIVPLPLNAEELPFDAIEMTPAQGRRLRDRIQSHPGDAPARASLLGYAEFHRDEKDSEAVKDEQLVWFVANMPDAPFLSQSVVNVDVYTDANTYQLVRRLYDEALTARPKDAKVLVNYANFVEIGETDHAIELLKRASAAEPRDGSIYEELGHAYALASRGAHGSGDHALASAALDAFLKARSLGHPSGLAYVVDAAYDAERYDVLRREAATALKEGEPYAVHHAHTALGRLALRLGDVRAAKKRLLNSARVAGSPSLNSFGPQMDLARELWAKGERSTVLAYLQAVGKFWQDERRTRWVERIESGGTPDWD